MSENPTLDRLRHEQTCALARSMGHASAGRPIPARVHHLAALAAHAALQTHRWGNGQAEQLVTETAEETPGDRFSRRVR
jgi:hypothetical protein